MLNKVQSPKSLVKGRTPLSKGRTLLFSIFFLLFSFVSYPQCAMCRAALESGGDTAKAEAVNDGIVYLMVIPYILVGAIGIMIYFSRKKKKELH